MRVIDGLAVAVAVASACAFAAGDLALANADDLRAAYWLVVGAVGLRASIQLAKPGAA